jgi:hypothetical protein
MNKSIGGYVLIVGTALYLLANGVLGIFFGSQSGGEFYTIFASIFGDGGGATRTIAIIIAILAIVAGVALLLRLLGVELAFVEIILIGFCILWLLYMIFADIIHPITTQPNFFIWLAQFATHLIILGAFVTSTYTFGGSY